MALKRTVKVILNKGVPAGPSALISNSLVFNGLLKRLFQTSSD